MGVWGGSPMQVQFVHMRLQYSVGMMGGTWGHMIGMTAKAGRLGDVARTSASQKGGMPPCFFARQPAAACHHATSCIAGPPGPRALGAVQLRAGG